MRPVPALASLAFLAATIVGCSTYQPSGSPQSASPTPSSSHPSPSPTPTADAQIVQTQGGVVYASWSPDGRWLLVTSTAGRPSLFDASGRLLRALDADAAKWITANTLLVWAHGTAHTETVDGDSVPLSTTPLIEGLANGHGAFAYLATETGPAAQFVVWTAEGTTGPRPGDPIGWSSDGTRLAVWHPTGPVTGPGASGSLEILDWPSLRTVTTAGDHLTGNAPPVFDPSGRYVAFLSGSPVILDLTSGTVEVIDALGASDTIAWDFDGNLRYPAADGGIVAVSVTGTRVGDSIAGDAVDSPANGTLVVVYTPQAGPNATLITDEGSRTVTLPGPIEPFVAVAPDGSAVAFICDGGDELVLVRH